MTRAVKAVADRIAAAVLLLLLSPIFLAIVLWVWLDDGRPAVLSQQRAGKDGGRVSTSCRSSGTCSAAR